MQSAGPNNGVAMINAEVNLIVDVKTEEACFRKKAASDEDIPCVIFNLKAGGDYVSFHDCSYLTVGADCILKVKL